MDNDQNLIRRLNEKNMEAQMQAQENRVYTLLLMTLGILLIMFITGVIIVNEFIVTREYVALFIMGLILFFAGWLWKSHDDNNIISSDENLEDFGNISDEGERRFSQN